MLHSQQVSFDIAIVIKANGEVNVNTVRFLQTDN